MKSSVCISNISKNGVATIELNRPNVNNAYDEHFLKEFAGCLVKLKCDVNMREILETLQSFWTNVPRETYD